MRTDIMIWSFVIATAVSAGSNIGFYLIYRDAYIADTLITITYQGGILVALAFMSVFYNVSQRLYRGIKDVTWFIERITWSNASRDERVFLVSIMVFMPMAGISLGGLFAMIYFDLANQR